MNIFPSQKKKKKKRPVAYYSRKMTSAERNYVVTERELLATVEALRVFRCYLLSGQQFNLVTDNQPNTFLQTQPTLSRRQARRSEIFFFFFFFLGGTDIHYTSAMIAISRVCDVHHKPERPKLTTHLELFKHES